MANISDFKQVPISTILGDLSQYKYNPSGIVNVTLDRLSDMLDDKVEVVDPSNPFTYLLETSCLNTAFAIQEYSLLTRKLYPRLANNEDDLYLHMSDFDYMGRFSEPSTAAITFNILYDSFKTNAIFDQALDAYIFKLPRHYKVSINNQVFTLLYPIIIKETSTGIIDIRYDNTNVSDIEKLSTDYIEYFMINQFNNEKYIVFNITMFELDIEAVEIPIEKSKLFKNSINYTQTRQFYYLEAFYYDNDKWNKMLVTHTDEVYDINTPTVIIKVLQDKNTIDYYVPPVYINNNRMGSKVKFLVYTTSGFIDINFNDYKLDGFTFEYNPVFKDLDLDQYTAPLELISKVVYIQDKVVGGKGRIDFIDLKDNVISNSIGDRKTPITDKQLEFLSKQNNFTIIKSVDTLTDRIYNLQAAIPNALTRYPVTKINLDILEYSDTISNMVFTDAINKIDTNMYVIPKHTTFKLENNKLRIISKTEKEALDSLEGISLTTEINNNTYVSNFFHYILDLNNNGIDLRAYSIDTPKLLNINFKNYNNTTNIGVNTSSFTIAKQDNGYLIEVLVNVKKYSETIDFTNITPVIVYETKFGSRFYLEGSLVTIVNEKPLYHFYLNSKFAIDVDGNMAFTNFKDVNGFSSFIDINISSKLQLLYLTNYIGANYTEIPANIILNGSYLAVDNYLVTQEELSFEFGKELKYLKRNIHISTDAYTYETYNQDILLRYTDNVYADDDTILHYKGDIVYAINDGETEPEPIVQFRKGDIKLDEYNNPMPISNLDTNIYFNFLMCNYKLTRVTDINLLNYINYLNDYLVEVITYNILEINKNLLENTEAYITVPKNLDYVQVRKNNNIVTSINSQQSFTVDVYVEDRIFKDVDTKNNINYIIVDTIEKYLVSTKKISKSEIISILFSKLKEFIVNISFSKFMDADIEFLEILDIDAVISFNKLLVISNDGSYTLNEDIVINYIKVNS